MHKLRLAGEHIKRYHGHVLIATKKTGGKKYGDSVVDSTGKRVGECHNERLLESLFIYLLLDYFLFLSIAFPFFGVFFYLHQ